MSDGTSRTDGGESDLDSVEEWVLDTVRDRTELVVDGEQTHAAVFTGLKRLRQEAAQHGCPYSKGEVADAVHSLTEREMLYNWHGQLTLAEPEYLKTVIKNEKKSNDTRRILVGQVNELLQRLQSGAGQEAEA